MSDFINSSLFLFDHTLSAMIGVPVLLFFVGFFMITTAFGLFLMLKDAAAGKRGRR